MCLRKYAKLFKRDCVVTFQSSAESVIIVSLVSCIKQLVKHVKFLIYCIGFDLLGMFQCFWKLHKGDIWYIVRYLHVIGEPLKGAYHLPK